MKYIKKVILENFQSHKYTEIELDQYLNVIVGPSDQGKTAIIRGLKWALFNEPSGDFFIREGETECSVTVIFNDNSKIKRYRSKNKNVYYLYNNEGKELILEGFGTKVPQEVINKTSMRKVLLDSNQSNSINIGEQLEGPFLLSEKNATRANAIGRLVGVHIIDDALKDTLKDTRNLNIKKKNHEENLGNLKENLTQYDYLDELINKTEKLKIIKKHIYNNQLKLDKLVNISKHLNKINGEILLLKIQLKKLKNINDITNIEKKLTNDIQIYRYIFNAYNKLNRNKNNIKENENLLNSLKNIDIIGEKLNLASISLERVSKLSKINTNLENINMSISSNNKILKNLKEINKVDEKIDLIKKSSLKVDKLLDLKNRLDNINKSLSIGTIYIDKLSDIDSILDIKNSLELKNKQLQVLIKYKENYDTIVFNKSKTQKRLLQVNNEINVKLNEYKSILSNLKVCPLCFSNIDETRINVIVSNYK
ncbi:AAA family ATPase [Schnuerera sp.]|uniref:AAA family ATPase n=1 Tax=Schnuerera sp. TaxID=2794844 RepID=UPI002C6668C0|nr:AAA family ATPase [Schnuerera sp.]HSH35072.1 AAA family ATPase [Schnuerera sp.]